MTTQQNSAMEKDAIKPLPDAMFCTKCGVHPTVLQFYPLDLCKKCCLILGVQWKEGEIAARCEWCWSAKACDNVATWLCKHCVIVSNEHLHRIQNSIDEIEWKSETNFPIANDYGESRDWRSSRRNAHHRKKLPAYL